jgi:hypothetical protein
MDCGCPWQGPTVTGCTGLPDEARALGIEISRLRLISRPCCRSALQGWSGIGRSAVP